MKHICLGYHDQKESVAGEALQTMPNASIFRSKNSNVFITDASQDERKEALPLVFSISHTPIRQLAWPGAGGRCPHCGSIIYSRRHTLCGVCAHELPGELLLPKEEAERLQCLMRSEQRRHRTWMAKAFRQAMAASFLPRSLR